VLFFFIAMPLAAQTQSDWGFTLGNGAEVSYQVWSGIEIQRGDKSFSDADLAGNIIERTLRDRNGAPLLGFGVHFDQVQGSDDFDIYFSPMPGYPFFAQAPDARRIHNGDRVLLDVLEEVGTGKKVFDTFQVYVSGTPHADLPLPSHSVPGMIPEKTLLRLSHARLAYDTYEALPMVQDGSTSSGTHVFLVGPTLGEFTLSSEPGPGYFLEAIAEDNEVHFVSGEDLFSVSSDGPVVDQPGAWYLWVKFEPRPDAAVAGSPPSQDGSPPLEVSVSPTTIGARGLPASLVQIQNVSSKNVLAYTIRMRVADPNTGKQRPGRVHAVLRMRIDGTPNYLLPGQIANDKIQVNPSASASIDLVVFQDGSAWGPMTSDGAKRQWKAVRSSLYYTKRR
jgi:hypothetical protein